MMPDHNGNPLRGEIWEASFPTDPPGKNPRPVVIVSTNGRNQHASETVMVVPFSGAVERISATQILFPRGETGLAHDSKAKAEEITLVRKRSLIPPKAGLRTLSNTRVCQIIEKVKIATGC
jgi:mRNA-degrading endonuclease toxin of MazEF toxin-antitoxin module